MQLPPLIYSDELILLLSLIAIILLITAELTSLSYGATNLNLSKNKLQAAGFTFSVLFFLTVVIRMIELKV